MPMILRFALGASVALSLLAGRGVCQGKVLGDWKRGEGYVVLAESGSIGAAPQHRHIYLFYRIYNGRIPTSDILAIGVDAGSGGVSSAYRVEINETTRQPEAIEPLAFRLDANKIAFRIQSDGAEARLDSNDSTGDAPAFAWLRVPGIGGSALLPLIAPALSNPLPANGAVGVYINLANPQSAPRVMRQSSRHDDKNQWIIDVRSDDGAPPIFSTIKYSPRFPVPVWGQWYDTSRNEQIRFRIISHSSALARTISLGRGFVAGDPLLLNPELLLSAESVWFTGIRDLVAGEIITQFAEERRWAEIDPRPSPAIGEVVPFAYELFAVNAGVSTNTTKKQTNNPTGISPRGAVGLVFAGRFEAPDTRHRYEAWIIPGADERAAETDPPNAIGESVGKLLLRFVLGNATARLMAERGFNFRLEPGWFASARNRSAAESLRQLKPGKPKKNAPSYRRGSDAILIRRESDLSPVRVIFYRISDDLRSAVIFADMDMEGAGPASIVRRSLLDRGKDFFLAGGFSAFTNKKGASFLLTRSEEDGTQVDRIGDRSCSIEMIEERELPEEPWKLQFDPRSGRQSLWGNAIALAVGRNRYGDARPPRDGIVRRSDGEEMLIYESWEVDRPWWSEAVAVFPQQGVGVRFRPLVHARLRDPDEPGDGEADLEILPFEPPPPPPQPKGDPKTPRPSKEPKRNPKPKPEPAKPRAAPPVPGTPKTGG